MLTYLLRQGGTILHSAQTPLDLAFGTLDPLKSWEIAVGQGTGKARKILGVCVRYGADEGEKVCRRITSPLDGYDRLVNHAGSSLDLVYQRIKTCLYHCKFNGGDMIIEAWESDR
jgi:hypothetical protein